MGFYVDPKPLYSCSVCDAAVRVQTVDGVTTCHFDKCEHTGSLVHANVGAVAVGKGGLFFRAKRCVKDKVGQAATAVMGRTVVWL